MYLMSAPSSCCARTIPSYDDWLKLLSLIEPTSVTSPTFSFLPPAPALPPALVAVGLAEPQAERTSRTISSRPDATRLRPCEDFFKVSPPSLQLDCQLRRGRRRAPMRHDRGPHL